MRFVNPLQIAFLAFVVFAIGCSSTGTPVAPTAAKLTSSQAISSQSQTHLWGYYDVSMDVATKTVSAVLNRQAMFTANVVNFVNGKPMNLGFKINDTPIGADYVDVDIDVTITHPFPGLPQYNGYDVRGIFMGDGSATLEYNPDLIYPVLGNDQFMLPDPDDGFGGPDGYTRWFNKPEFSTGGMPLFQYTKGKLASAGFDGTSTLNPYKYFADGLGTTDGLWTWLNSHPDLHGQFSSGAANTRNYFLRFPNIKGVTFGYAIIANWAGEAPELHPSNAPEAIAVRVADASDVFYAGGSDKGGNLKLDLSVLDWDSKLSGGVMDYRIFIESTVLSGVHELNPAEMTPIGGGENYSTYHVEIPADNILGSEGNEYWVIVEQQGHDYTNEFGTANLADTDPLAALFRYSLGVATESGKPICDVGVVTPMPYTGWGKLIEFDASGSTNPGGGPLTYEWDFNDDGTFGDPIDQGTPDKPQKLFNNTYHGDVCVRVTNNSNAHSDCCVHVDITAYPSKNIPLRSSVDAYDIAVDHADGDLLVLYSDGQVWRYLESAYYQTPAPGGSPLFTTLSGVNHMDISANSYIRIGGNNDKSVSYSQSFSPTGAPLGSDSDPDGVFEVAGVTANTTPYDYQNCHCVLSGWFIGHPIDADYWFNRWTPGAEYMSGASGWYAWDINGIGGLNHLVCLGMETSADDDGIFLLEGAPEYTVEKWSVIWWNYQGVNWGGKKSDGMDGFNDPRNISRDSANNYYILDELTTGPAIKKYTDTGTPVGSPFGGWGIAGDPLKIEGSDYVGPYDNLLFVLSDGGSQPDMLSIFFKSEIP